MDELVTLLVPAGARLVMVCSCQSAAQVADDRLVMLGRGTVNREHSRNGLQQAGARTIASRLGCVVVAMRFAVSDAYVLGLIGVLYRELLDGGVPPATALANARDHVGARATPLEWATATILGTDAASLVIGAPYGDCKDVNKDEIPSPPARFVGRVAHMTRCGRVLAATKGPKALMLVGMPGVGKTTVATELVHLHRDGFDRVEWFAVPADADSHALFVDLLLCLESALPGLRVLDRIDGDDVPAEVLDELP